MLNHVFHISTNFSITRYALYRNKLFQTFDPTSLSFFNFPNKYMINKDICI